MRFGPGLTTTARNVCKSVILFHPILSRKYGRFSLTEPFLQLSAVDPDTGSRAAVCIGSTRCLASPLPCRRSRPRSSKNTPFLVQPCPCRVSQPRNSQNLPGRKSAVPCWSFRPRSSTQEHDVAPYTDTVSLPSVPVVVSSPPSPSRSRPCCPWRCRAPTPSTPRKRSSPTIPGTPPAPKKAPTTTAGWWWDCPLTVSVARPSRTSRRS